MPYWLEFLAVMTGGLSGAMSAVRARYDVFGCAFIACVTGLGGGMMRDLLLQDYGIYAFQNPSLLIACVVASIIVFYFGRLATYLDPLVDLLDNLSVASWCIIGSGKSMSAGLGIVPSIILGTLTAVGGGILRDVLMNRRPEAFQAGPIYGSAALLGCALYCVLDTSNILPSVNGILCAGVVLTIRYAALAFGWRTRPARDYSDVVTHAVKKPFRFIARKVHVPVGKTARDRDNSPAAQLHRAWGRFYNRISGHWMDAAEGEGEKPAHLTDQMPPLVKVQLTEEIAPVGSGSRRRKRGKKGANLAGAPSDRADDTLPGSPGKAAADAGANGRASGEVGDGGLDWQHSMAGQPGGDASSPADAADGPGDASAAPAPSSDRIFVDRTELHRLMYELGNTGEVDRSGAVGNSGALDTSGSRGAFVVPPDGEAAHKATADDSAPDPFQPQTQEGEPLTGVFAPRE